MAGLRFTALQSRPMEFLDFTSLTLDEFQQLVPPFEAAFHARMAAWRLDGKPRTARQFAIYKNCPVPTPEDRLFFILTYLKTYALQVVHGRLFGMGQSKANQWIHALLPVLLAALRTLGDAPARSVAALAQRLGVSEADAATVVGALEEEPAPVATSPSPLVPMTAVSMTSGLPRPPHIPCLRGVGCCRISASCRLRCLRWRSSCRRRSPVARSSRWSNTSLTRLCTTAGCGSSMSTAVSSAAGS